MKFPQNLLLEEKLAKYSIQLGELEDLAGENRELRQAVLKKDSAMEELEKRLAQEKEDAEVSQGGLQLKTYLSNAR